MPDGVGRDRAAYELDGELVLAARDGDDDAFAALFNRWFDPVYDAARRIVHDSDVAAEVTQDTFLAVWRHLDSLREPSTFGAFALRTARNRALNRSERERRSVAVDEQDLVPVIDRTQPSIDTAEVVARHEDDSLVWAASAALGDRDASLLDLHLRHGLTAPELAEEMGVTANNAHQLLFRLKKKLGVAIEAWVIWRGGSPSCDALAAELHRAGVTQFSAEAVRVVNRHVDGCDECGERKATALAPEALFASVPIAIASPAVREKVAQGLRQLGVPATTESGAPTSTRHSTATRRSTSADGPAPGAPTDGGLDRADQDGGVGGDDCDGITDTSTSRVTRRVLLAGAALAVVVLVLGGGFAVSRSRPADVVEAESRAGAQPSTLPPTAANGGTAPSGTDGGEVPGTDVTGVGPTGTGEADGAPASSDPNLSDANSTTAPADGPTPQPTITFAVPQPAVTVTNPPTPTAPSTTASTNPPPPPSPPIVVTFTAALQSGAPAPCGSGERKILLSWSTTDATGVTIAGPGAPTGTQPPTGIAIACAPPPGPSTYVLTATGAGGSTNLPRTA